MDNSWFYLRAHDRGFNIVHIVIGSDHRGFELKTYIISNFGMDSVQFYDAGCYSHESCDYPEIAKNASNYISQFSVLICNTGIGMSIAANKLPNLTAALCINEEMAYFARKHNNANTLILGSKYITPLLSIQILNEFIQTQFEGGRHEERIKKIHCKS